MWTLDCAYRKYSAAFSNLFATVAVSCVKVNFGFEKLWQTIESALQQQEWLGDLIPTKYFKMEDMLRAEAKKRNPPIITHEVR